MAADAYTPITTETRLSLPLNGTIYTTVRQVAPEKTTPAIGGTMKDELGPDWEGSLIISANIVPSENKERQQIVHARIPSEADQLSSNWSFSTCSMGGQRFPSVQRTVILKASEVEYATPAKGSAMPFEEGSIFDGQGYILADRSVVRSGMQLEPVFRVEQRNYVKKSTIKQIGIDPLNGQPLTSQSDLYYATEKIASTADDTHPDGYTIAALFALPNNAFWGIQATGSQRTGNQLSCEWFSVITSQVVGGTFTEGVVNCGTYTTNDEYYWPPVLETYELLDWDRLDGGTEIYPAVRFHPEGYTGPCHTSVTRTWSKSPQTIAVVTQMKPTSIHYSCPYYAVNISECLHGAVAFQCDIGSMDPIYDENTGSTRHFAATNYTVWPDTIVAYDNQTPFRGGYLRTTRTVTKPTIPANVNWTTGAAI